MILNKQKTKIIFAVPALLVLTAFFANLWVEGWNWSPLDFFVAAVLLFGTAFLVNLVIRSGKTNVSKLMICFAILLVLALIWMELAVGIFGSPFAGN
jgi:Ca2+/H+ antiporter